MSLMTLVAALWLIAVVGGVLSRHRARRDSAWLRSDVPAGVAYARLRAEIDRQAGGAPGGDSAGRPGS